MLSKRAALCLLLVGCGEQAPATDGTPIGLLLPYTGKDGSAGSNFERGALMAVSAVNESGGVYHQRLRVVYADTRSTVEDGLKGADALLAQGVIAIVGPENDDLAQQLAPRLASRGVPLITPSSSAPPMAGASKTNLWFRLAPSATDLGTAIGRRIKSDHAERVAIVHTPAAYEASFARGAQLRLEATSVPIVAKETISSSDASFDAAIRRIEDSGADAVLLAADAITASRFVDDFTVLVGSARHWYASPTLEDSAFVINSFPEAVEGIVGVAPAVSNDDEQISAFSAAFADSWAGATPTTGSYFYYDAVALFALAVEGAAADTANVAPPGDVIRDHMLAASGQSGLVVQWDELGKGLAEAETSANVYYAGLTGVISLDASGARSAAYTRFWTIKSGDISDL